MSTEDDKRAAAIAKLNAANVPLAFGRYTSGIDPVVTNFMIDAVRNKKCSRSLVIGSSTGIGKACLGGVCKELVFAGVNLQFRSMGELYNDYERGDYSDDADQTSQTFAIAGACDRAESLYPAPFRMSIQGRLIRRLYANRPIIMNIVFPNGAERLFVDQLGAWYGDDLVNWLKDNALIVRV